MPNDIIQGLRNYASTGFNEIKLNTNQDFLVKNKEPELQFFDESLSEKFTAQKDYNPYGFNPFDEGNTQRWIDKETWGTALRKGFSSFGNSFGNTFKDYWVDYGRMVDALVHLDWDKMYKSEPEMIDQYFRDKINANKNFVFVPKGDEDGIFNRKTMSEFIGNAGFMAGTSAAFFLELAADVAITILSGGSGAATIGASASRIVGQKAAAQAPEILAKTIGKEIIEEGVEQGIKQATKPSSGFMKTMKGVADGYFNYANKSVDQIKQLNKIDNAIKEVGEVGVRLRPGLNRETLRGSIKDASQIYAYNINNIIGSKSFSELANNIVKGVPVVGQAFTMGEKIAAGAKAGLSTGELVGMGAWGLKRMANVINMAGTEASFEAVTSYGETLNQIINQYELDNNGAPVTPEFFEKAREAALNSAAANYNVNMGILLATNDIQFGNLYNKFLPSKKWASDIFKEGAEDILVVRGKDKVGKMLTKEYVKDFFGVYGNIGKIATDFTKKQAVFEVGKSFMRSFGKFELTEGLQENLQDVSSSTWRDYYSGQVLGAQKTMRDNFGEAFASQFTKQGLKTFLMGAFTGMLMSPAMKTTQYGMKKLQSYAAAKQYFDPNDPESRTTKNPVYQAEQQMKKDMDIRNQFYADIASGKKLEDLIFNMQGQVNAAGEMTDAATVNSEYDWHNGHNNSILLAAWSANTANTIDAFVQSIRDAGDNLSSEELQSLGVSLKNTKYGTTKELFNNIADDVLKYSNIIDGLRKKVVSMSDPLMFKRGTKEFYVAAVMKNVQEDALKMISFNHIKSTMAAERAQKISSEFASIHNIGQSSDYAIKILSNYDNLLSEQGLIMAEIKNLEKELNSPEIDGQRKKEIRKSLNNKNNELKLLQEWEQLWNINEEYEEVPQSVTVDGEEKVVTTKKLKSRSAEFRGKDVSVNYSIEDTDLDGNVVEKKIDKVYVTKHKDVTDLFTRIMNIKNEQAGINDFINSEEIYEAFDKITDFIQLSKDSKDYMKAVESLFVPENMRAMITNMLDGRMKYHIITSLENVENFIKEQKVAIMSMIIQYNPEYVNSMEDIEKQTNIIINEYISEIRNTDSYKKILALAISDYSGDIENEYLDALFKELNESFVDIHNKISIKYGWPIEEEKTTSPEPIVPAEPQVESEEPETSQENEGVKTKEDIVTPKSQHTELNEGPIEADTLDEALKILETRKKQELKRKRDEVKTLAPYYKEAFEMIEKYISYIEGLTKEEYNSLKAKNAEFNDIVEYIKTSQLSLKQWGYDKPLENLIDNQEDIDTVYNLAYKNWGYLLYIEDKYEQMKQELIKRFSSPQQSDVTEPEAEAPLYDIETLVEKISVADAQELENITKFVQQEGIYNTFKEHILTRLDALKVTDTYRVIKKGNKFMIEDVRTGVVMKKSYSTIEKAQDAVLKLSSNIQNTQSIIKESDPGTPVSTVVRNSKNKKNKKESEEIVKEDKGSKVKGKKKDVNIGNANQVTDIINILPSVQKILKDKKESTEEDVKASLDRINKFKPKCD